MLVSDILNLAKKSELRQLAVKDDDAAVVGFINLGVLELYKRFPLMQDEAIITLQDGKSLYKLDGTDTNVSMGITKNFLIVSDCYDEQGDQVMVNDERDPLGIMTPSFNTVEVPNVAQDERLSVIYRVAPDFIKRTTDTVDLPPQLLEALLHYIGYRGHATISSDVKEENNTHYIRFTNSCERVQTLGLITADDLESYTFDIRGFA